MLENVPDAQGAYNQFQRFLHLSLLQLKYPDPNEAVSLFFVAFNQLWSITEEKALQSSQSHPKKSLRASLQTNLLALLEKWVPLLNYLYIIIVEINVSFS